MRKMRRIQSYLPSEHRIKGGIYGTPYYMYVNEMQVEKLSWASSPAAAASLKTWPPLLSKYYLPEPSSYQEEQRKG